MQYYGDMEVWFRGPAKVLRELPDTLEKHKRGIPKKRREVRRALTATVEQLKKKLGPLDKAPDDEAAEVLLNYFSECADVDVAGFCEAAKAQPEMEIQIRAKLGDSISDKKVLYTFFSRKGENDLAGEQGTDQFFLKTLEY